MEVNQQNSIKKKIISFGLILSIILSSIIYLYISNNSTNSNTRRKINEIQQDITHLYNYTETMSDFIVDNYKVPEITLDLDLKKFINISLQSHMELKMESHKNQLELKMELNNFKNKSLKTHMELKMESHKNQLELKMELNDFKNKSLKTHMELKIELNEMNKNFIRKTAVEYLNKYYGLFKPDFQYYQTSSCINKLLNIGYFKLFEELLNIDYFKLFEELLNIDYENKIVSFAYFTEDTIENFKSHPLYKIINNSLEYDYDWLNNTVDYITDSNENRIWYKLDGLPHYIPSYFRNLTPFKTLCNYPIGKFHSVWSTDITKIYNEYEYISRMISFVTIRPQKFM
jgi:hypothetical protein